MDSVTVRHLNSIGLSAGRSQSEGLLFSLGPFGQWLRPDRSPAPGFPVAQSRVFFGVLLVL
jgi:hypothetical protein